MANAIGPELARFASKVAEYATSIFPQLAEVPWPVSPHDHTAAVQRRRANTIQANRENAPKALPLQAWMLYHLRRLLTDELLGALSTFGGLADALNHLSIVLNIATTDTIAVAHAYGRPV